MKTIELKPKDDARAALEYMKRNTDVLLEHVELLAKLNRARYEAYIKEGFTAEEALDLCKTELFK